MVLDLVFEQVQNVVLLRFRAVVESFDEIEQASLRTRK
jgi:hypothetical protein